MNADAFRHFYGYHFSENRKIWDSVEQNVRDYLAELRAEFRTCLAARLTNKSLC
jgi:uncharacterized damage-inducible protein DinB